MPLSLNSTMVQSIVVAIIVFLIQLLFLEFLVLANANMQREIQGHGDFGSFTSIKVRTGKLLTAPGNVYEVRQANGTGNELKCALTTNIAAESNRTSIEAYSEDGNRILLGIGADAYTAGSVLTDATLPTCIWDVRPAVVEQFAGIILIIGEIIPLLLVVSVASEAFMLVYLRGTQGGISQVVGSRVALLVVAYIVILFSGTVFEFTENAAAVFLSDAVTGTDRFEQISKLLLSLVPLAYELMVLGVLGWSTYSTARAVRTQYNSGRNQRPALMAGGGMGGI